MRDWGFKGRGITFVGLAIVVGTVAYVVGVESAEAGAPPAVISFEEGMTAGTFLRTVRLTGTALNKAKAVNLTGPSPSSTPRSAVILLGTKETIVLSLPSGIPQGDYSVQLLDRKFQQLASASVRLTLGAPGLGSVPASAITGQIPATQISGAINATTLGGLSSAAFLRTTGGTLTGPILFSDSQGTTRGFIGTNSVAFADEVGTFRSLIGTSSSGQPVILFRDAAGTQRLRMGSYSDTDGTYLDMADASGVSRITLDESDGLQALVMNDAQGNDQVFLSNWDLFGFGLLIVKDNLGNSTTYGP